VQEVEPDTIEKEVKKQDEIGVKVKDLDFLDDTGFSSDDFKDYLSKRKINSVPTQLKTPEQDTTFSYSEFLERQRKEKEEPKTIKQQINSLSPELKAMLIAGVLDRKKFD